MTAAVADAAIDPDLDTEENAAAPAGWDAATATACAWIPVCALDAIIPDTGVCALVGDRQIALVRLAAGDQVFALDNFDPFSKAFVISRGIVGDRNGVAKIASPIHKQSFSLASGQCLDDPTVSLATYLVRVRDGQVELQLPDAPGSEA